MSLKAFFKESAIRPENVRVVVSPRFVEDGRPLEWELRPITEAEHAKIKESCTKKQMTKGRAVVDYNTQRYALRLTAASVVEPNLADAELQASYGVVGEEALLEAMLLPGEMIELQRQVQMVNGFDTEFLETAKDEVKNS